jgi:hypothetical protein
MEHTTFGREVRAAERVLEKLERELWFAIPAFERFHKAVAEVYPDGVCNKDRVKEGITRAIDELHRMFDDVHSAGVKIPF